MVAVRESCAGLPHSSTCICNIAVASVAVYSMPLIQHTARHGAILCSTLHFSDMVTYDNLHLHLCLGAVHSMPKCKI
jgi:hypothetical protein